MRVQYQEKHAKCDLGIGSDDGVEGFYKANPVIAKTLFAVSFAF